MAEGDSKGTVTKAAYHFLTGTFISRVTGMIRDLSMAYCFGTSPAVAGFLIAFRLSNLFRRLFGEGALLNGFIPFFEGIRKENPMQGSLFFRNLFWSLSLILIILIISLEGVCSILLSYCSFSSEVRHIIHMAMLMFPGLLFIGLFGLSMALLECERSFFIPGIAPVAFNIVWIMAIWLLRGVTPHFAMLGLSASIVVAFFVQWWVTLPGVKVYVSQFLSLKEWLRPELFTKELKDMIVPLLLGVLGVAAVQINSALDVIIARIASPEGPAYLSYAHRLQQFPLALFGIAIASALMPPLTRAIKSDDEKQFASLLKFGLSRTFSLLLPGSVAIFVLGGASVNLLYGRGVFNNTSTIYTTLCLWGYGLGLVPSAFVLLLAPAFYARRDFWTPTLGSLLSVAINLVLNLLMVFVFHFGAMSIALCTSITAFFNMRFLLRRLHIEVMPDLIIPFMKIIASAVTAGLVTLFVGYFLLNEPSLSLLFGRLDVMFTRLPLNQLKEFFSLTTLFGVIFLMLSYLMRIEEVMQLFTFRRKS